MSLKALLATAAALFVAQASVGSVSIQPGVLFEETRTVSGEYYHYKVYSPQNLPSVPYDQHKPIRVDLIFSKAPTRNYSETLTQDRWAWECIVGPGKVAPCAGNSYDIYHSLKDPPGGRAFSHYMSLYTYEDLPFTPEQIAAGNFGIRYVYGNVHLLGTWVDFEYEGEMTYTLRYTLVPEPGSWAMMVLGFWLLGGAIRSDRQLRNRSSIDARA